MSTNNFISRLAAAIVFFLVSGSIATAQDSDAELAKKLSNPVASLIQVPLSL